MVEFRQHEGTVSAESAVIQWAEFIIRFVGYAINASDMTGGETIDDLAHLVVLPS